jgi:hypothetical protein
VYPHRWVVLGAVTSVNLTIRTLWIGYAAITGPAAEFYGVADVAIGLFGLAALVLLVGAALVALRLPEPPALSGARCTVPLPDSTPASREGDSGR